MQGIIDALFGQTNETVNRKLDVICCCMCGVDFGVPSSFVRGRRDTGDMFYCPNGHPLTFGQTTKDRLEKELIRERQKLDQAQAEIEWQKKKRSDVERSLTATKGVVTRLKNRAQSGTCPCCNRTFSDLAQHMANKHPSFAHEE